MADLAQQQTGDAHRRTGRDAGWSGGRPCRRPTLGYHAGLRIVRGRARPGPAASLGDIGRNTITIG